MFNLLAERDAKFAKCARSAIAKGIEFLRAFLFPQDINGTSSLARADYQFWYNGYVALFEIEDSETVTALAIRHQREEDFF